MIELTRQEIADLRKCTPATVSRACLPRTTGKKYDLLNPVVWAYVTTPYLEDKVRELKEAGRDDLEENGLDEEEARARIEYKNRQIRKLDVEHEKEIKNLQPIETVCLWIGAFSSGVKTNFLTIGKRIAKGNKDLQDKIDGEVSRAISKTLDSAAGQLRTESEKLIEAMEAKN